MYLKKFGFKSDPFQSTNASEEPTISDYFVPPPYFEAVKGDPTQPKSQVILAPRGGGKTAQRVMLEQASHNSKDYLCIVYDDFLLPENAKLSDIDLTYHIRNVNELITLSILLECSNQNIKKNDLPNGLVKVLKESISIYLGKYSQQVHSGSIGKFKNIGDKASDIWESYGGKISLLVNGVLDYLGAGSVDLSALAKNPENYDQSHQFYLKKLGEISKAIGYKSIYVLVDRVDETSLTSSDAEKSYAFIRPLISDLHILETSNIAFKFFLWDQIHSHYSTDGARPDRVKIYKLNWSVREIHAMLTERLRSFSDKKTTSLNQMVETDLNAHLLVSYVAERSPRDLIRACGRIVDEQVRISDNDDLISENAMWSGIESFCNERSEELFPQHITELKKVGAPTFTNRMLANDIFRKSENAIRPKIQSWQSSGAVDRIGDVPNPGNRPLYLYGLTDIRLCVAALANTSTADIFGNYLIECFACKRINITDQDQFDCSCGSHNKLSGSKSIYELCQLK